MICPPLEWDMVTVCRFAESSNMVRLLDGKHAALRLSRQPLSNCPYRFQSYTTVMYLITLGANRLFHLILIVSLVYM